MKLGQLVGIGLIIFSLVVLYAPLNLNFEVFTPVPPETKVLAQEIELRMEGERVQEDAQIIGLILRSGANVFVLDTQREQPYYSDNEDLKWAIRNIGDITYPDGWRMEDKYPKLHTFLGQWMQENLGDDFSRKDLVREMRVLADAFDVI